MGKENKPSRKDFLDNIEKSFGKKSKIKVEDPKNIERPKFPTGSLKLDIALKGGYPKGTMIESFGKSQSGKTTSAIEGVAQHQKKYPDEKVLWLDLEGIFDPEYNEAIGVDISSENFMLVEPNTGEEAYQLMVTFMDTFKGGLIIVDSVAALLPEKEDAGDFGDANMGVAARLNSQGCRKLRPRMRKNNTTIIFLNQTRVNIGKMFGDPNESTGGSAIEFFSRTRLKFGAMKGEKDTDTGVSVLLDKANFGNPKMKIETNIVYGKGFDVLREILDISVSIGLIEQGGAWFSYEESKIGQGKDQVLKMFKDNPELVEELTKKIKIHYGI